MRGVAVCALGADALAAAQVPVPRHAAVRAVGVVARLRAVALAQYPMYRGVARLVGMDVREVPPSAAELVPLLKKYFDEYDFFFLHFKYTDSTGEDGDFEGKVEAIESMDAVIPGILEASPEVLVVTGDHSTPATFRAHSWHSVPVLLA